MKNLMTTVLFFLFTFGSQAQNWNAKLENAQFQTRVNNHSAYTRDVKKTQGIFTDDEFELILNRCLTKEGVFRLEMSSDNSTITVYSLEWVDHLTIDWLFTEASSELSNILRIHPKEEFNF